MNIALYGATGKTGRLLLEQALTAGHQVTALVSDPGTLTLQAGNLKVLTGDATDPVGLERALVGTDAVISTLSAGNGRLAAFASHIVPLMKRHGVTRIISLVGAGVSEPGDPASFGRNTMLGLMKLLAQDVLSDATLHAQVLRTSDLDWTLVRPPRLLDGPALGDVAHGPHLKLGPSASIPRADLAAFMLQLAESGEYTWQSPMVAGRAPRN